MKSCLSLEHRLINSRFSFAKFTKLLIYTFNSVDGWLESHLIGDTENRVGRVVIYAHIMQVCHKSVHISTTSRNVVTVKGHPMFNSHGINRCKRYEPSNKSMKSKTYADSSITSKQINLDNGNA